MLERIKASFSVPPVTLLGALRLRIYTRAGVLTESLARCHKKLVGATAIMLAFQRRYSNNKCNTALFRSFGTPSVSRRSAAQKIRGYTR